MSYGLQFIFFFVLFSRDFCYFWSKNQKALEKAKKKNEINKIARLIQVQAGELGSAILFFLLSRGFTTFGQKPKKPRENQKNEKTKLPM